MAIAIARRFGATSGGRPWEPAAGRPAPGRSSCAAKLERVNGEIKRRTEVVGIFPSQAAITGLAGAILLEQNDAWAVQRARYMTPETIAPMRDDLTLMLPAAAT